jgi:transcriptional regulator with XRE-family HTH domain
MNKNNLPNNLYELRKLHGLSQEEMAEKLYVSRQAVSKWERGEAYPDTENLITISEMFNISLDDLVRGDLSAKSDSSEASDDGEEAEYFEILDDDESDTQKKKVSVNLTGTGLHINVEDEEEKEKVYVKFPGLHIHVNDSDDDDDVDDDNDYNTSARIRPSRGRAIHIWASIPYSILVCFAFLLIGFLTHGWYWAWTLFLTIPVYHSLIDAIRRKRFSDFAYPVFLTFVYCLIGMLWHAWHPWWLIFVTIAIYYPIADALDEWIRR